MHINEGKGKIALFYTANNVLLTPLLFTILLFSFLNSFIPIFPSSSSSFLLFPLLLLLHLLIFIVFSPSPPPSHFYCFPSSSATFLLFCHLLHYELTNENVSYFLTNQSKTKTFIDLKVTRNPKPTKNSTRPYLNEIPAHFTHEIKTKGYDVIDVNWFLRELMRFLRILFMRSRQ